MLDAGMVALQLSEKTERIFLGSNHDSHYVDGLIESLLETGRLRLPLWFGLAALCRVEDVLGSSLRFRARSGGEFRSLRDRLRVWG